MDNATYKALARFVALMTVAVLIGFLQGNVELYLLLAIGGFLLWHLWNLSRFEAWIKAGAREDVPDLPGVWGELVSFIIRLKRRSRSRKRQYRNLIKEYRKSSGAFPDGTVLLDGQNQILWFNKAATRMLGLRKASDRGQSIVNFVRRPEFVRFIESSPGEEALVMPAPREPGHFYSLQRVPYGRKQSLLLVRDITQEVTVEQTRRDFVANASHELRTPLTVLSGYLDAMVEDPGLAESWGDPVREMQAQTARMTEIVAGLLTLSRLEAQEEQENPAEAESVNVPAMLTAIRKEALAAPGCPDTVELNLLSDAWLLGSESDLRSAFSNLVENAVKYTPRQGSIILTWESRADGSVEFRVKDTGVGLSPSEIPRVTERFYRVDSGRSRDVGGTGLGLAIVKHVLRGHDANLIITSLPGDGSCFSCVFPASRVAKPDESGTVK